MPSNPHTIGPRKRVVMWLYDADGVLYAELECGHAVRMTKDDARGNPRTRSCPLCCERRVSPHRLKKCLGDAKAAKLEGKRQRALAYYRAKKEAPPEPVLKQRSEVALYESLEDVPR